MRFERARLGIVAMVAIGASLVVTSCTCKIKEEQLASIQQLRASEKQLNADITKATGDKTRITNELNARQGEVRKCNEKKAFVQDKMSKWPNVWPDYTPAPTNP